MVDEPRLPSDGGRNGGASDSANLSIRELNNRIARPRHVGPLQRLTLFASGVPSKLIEAVPVERTEFLVQGTGVLIAATMATVGAFVASSMLVDPAPILWARLAIAFGFGMLIFTVDRLLVRSPLRPFHFPKHILHTLWDPSADAKWYDVLAGSIQKESIFKKIGGIVTVFLKVALRLALAGFLSYLVADLIVLYAFAPAVDARATTILTEQQQTAYQNADQNYTDAVAAADKKRSTTIATISKDPNISTAQKALDDAQARVKNLEKDVDLLTKVADAEQQGVPGISVKLSDDSVFPASGKGTTGDRGCSTECRDLLDLLAQKTNAKNAATNDLATKQRHLNRASGGASGTIATANEQYKTDVRDAKDVKDGAYSKAADLATTPSGLLIRRTALQQLEQDTTPWTDELNPQSACSNGFVWLCELRRSIFPSTPLGSYVGVFRAVLFLIDILPITMKVYYSLRGRRPFDVLLAALEESSVADSMNKLDYELNDVGAEMERRAVDRRGERNGQGARVIRHATASERRQRLQMERRMREMVRLEYEAKRGTAPSGRRAWRRTRDLYRARGRQPTSLMEVNRKNSPWSEPRYFDPSSYSREDLPQIHTKADESDSAS